MFQSVEHQCQYVHVRYAHCKWWSRYESVFKKVRVKRMGVESRGGPRGWPFF